MAFNASFIFGHGPTDIRNHTQPLAFPFALSEVKDLRIKKQS